MYLEELKQKIGEDKEIQALLKRRSEAKDKKANALSRQSDIAEKRREKKDRLDKIRAGIKAVILEGKDPEALHRDERDIAASLKSLDRWIDEIETSIVPSLDEEMQAIKEELKKTVLVLTAKYGAEKQKIFNERLDELEKEISDFETAVRKTMYDLDCYVDQGSIILKNMKIRQRIYPI